MKKLLIIATMMLVCFSGMWAEKAKINFKGDSIVIIDNGDTAVLKDSTIKVALNKAINDTIWSSNLDEDGDFEDIQADAENRKTAAEISTQWANVAETATYTIFAGIVVVVFLCLFFYYLNRRAKYKAIEKAIENNYPLPPSLGGSSQPKVAQQPNAWRNYTPPTPTPPAASGPAPQQPAPGSNMPPQPPMAPAYYRTNYQAYKGSFKLIAVGLALMIFFLFCGGAMPMVGMMTMLVLLGLGKALITYKEIQQDKDYWQWQAMQNAQNAQPFATAPQQPAAPQPQPDPEQEPQPPVFTNPDNKQ